MRGAVFSPNGLILFAVIAFSTINHPFAGQLHEGKASHGDVFIATSDHALTLINSPTHQSGILILTSAADNPYPMEVQISVSNDSTTLVDVRWESISKIAPELPSSPREIVADSHSLEVPRIRFIENSESTSKIYYLHDARGPLLDPRSYQGIKSSLIAEGEQTRVFLDSECQMSERYRQLAKRIIEALEGQVMPTADRITSRFVDVDQDGKLRVLLTPHLNRIPKGESPLRGFVRRSDFRRDYPKPYSNHSDVIYLYSEVNADILLTLLAHEYWHVLEFGTSAEMMDCQKKEDWTSEGAAHLAECLFGGDGSNLDQRIQAWLKNPEDAPLQVENYYQEGLWRDAGCRGSTSLFFRWCYSIWGAEVLRKMRESSFGGVECLEELSGLPIGHLQQLSLASLVVEQFGQKDSSAPRDNLINVKLFPKSAATNLRVHNPKTNDDTSVILTPSASSFFYVKGQTQYRMRKQKEGTLSLTFVPLSEKLIASNPGLMLQED